MLEACQRDFVFLVREVEPNTTRNQERAAHQRKDEQEVATKQPPALNARDISVLFLDCLYGLQREPLSAADSITLCRGRDASPARRTNPAGIEKT